MNSNRALIFILLGVAASACFASQSATARADGPAAAAIAKPNILWIIGEDLGPNLACYGTPAVATPNLDRLAAEGCRYTRAFATAPVCSAARSALITGAYQTSFGAQHHRSNRQPDAPGLPDGVRLITDRLRDVGYYTAIVSRFPESSPIEAKGKTDWNFANPEKPFDTINWSQLAKHQPFFAQINFEEAHRIYHHDPAHAIDPAQVVLPPYLADTPLIREDWAAYLEDIQILDGKVGQVLRLLAADGLADNTIVIFLGDNGREDFRGKYHLYEQGTQIPLIVRAPELLKPGTVSERLVSGVDITATTLALAGITVPAASHGRPFFGPQAGEREYVYTALDRIDDNPDRVRAVRDARWKYLRNYEPDRPYLQENGYRATTNPTYLAMKKLHAEQRLNLAQSKFMASSRPVHELYDLQADPFELKNLADDPQHADVLHRLQTELDRWMTLTGDDRQTAESPASRKFSLEEYERTRPRNHANNLKRLRKTYQKFDELEPVAPPQP